MLPACVAPAGRGLGDRRLSMDSCCALKLQNEASFDESSTLTTAAAFASATSLVSTAAFAAAAILTLATAYTLSLHDALPISELQSDRKSVV